MPNNVYLNGQIIPAEQARISVFDTGLLHGASVFTTMLAHNGKVFRLDRHLQRLMDNARRINLRVGASQQELTEGVARLLAANELKQARLRITLTPGAGAELPEPTSIITATPFTNPQSWYAKGIHVIVSSVLQYDRDPLAGVKTGCYLPRMLARQAAAAVEADEALWFTTSGNLAEGCFCNVFLVKAGQVRTPPLNTPVLPGVVREAVLELCSAMGVDANGDQALRIDELLQADEVFLTSSVAGIRPAVRLNGRAIGNQQPGPVYRKIQQAYRELLERECPGE